MNPGNHPASSAHQIPSGKDVASTIQYVLRSSQPTIRALKKLVQGQLEEILDITPLDLEMKGIVFAYGAQKKLSRTDAERMRRFLWGKFVISQDEEAEEDDIMEYGSKKLQTLGVKIRELHLQNWWAGDMTEAASGTIVPLLRAIISEYRGDEGEDSGKNNSATKATKVAVKRTEKPKYKESRSYGDAEISVDREDAMSAHLALTMIGSYFEAMDMKIDNKISLSQERDTGRWKAIQNIVVELKKFLTCITITDAIDEYFCDFSSGLHAVIRLADTYAMLHEDKGL